MPQKKILALLALMSSIALLLNRSIAADQGPTTSTEPWRLEEIVVTAEKRSEEVQKVPSSVNVISAAELQDLNSTNIIDFAARVPGLNVDSGGAPGQVQLTLRGVANIATSATVATFIDDVPVGSSNSFSQGERLGIDLLPYDIERIEVLSGPQGTLYGASSMGGLLKYVMRSPDTERTQIQVGTDVAAIQGSGDATYGVRAMVNVPLIDNALGVRVSYSHRSTAGYIDNPVLGAKGVNGYTEDGGRASIAWTPAENLRLTLSALLQDIDADANSFVQLDSKTRLPIYNDLANGNQVLDPSHDKERLYTATLTWEVGWADFLSATGYERTRTRLVTDVTSSFGALIPLLTGGSVSKGLTPLDYSIDLRKFTQEFRLTSANTGRLHWLAGAFYSDQNIGQVQSVVALNAQQMLVPTLNPFFVANLPSKYREEAIFGDLTYTFTPAFDIGAGIREAHNSQSFSSTESGILAETFGIAGSSSGSSAEGVTTYMGNSRYHFDQDTMAYVRVASSYRPGGPNPRLPNVPSSFAADKLTNYEIGFKSELLEHRALVNASVYYIDWSNTQITVAFGPFSGLGNAGKISSRGAELTSSYAVSRDLRLGISMGYTDAIFERDIPTIGIHAGDRVWFAPRWNGAATADYSVPVANSWDFRGGGVLRYVSNRLTPTIGGTSTNYELPGYGILDLYSGVSNQRWTVSLFAKNAANRRAYLGATPPLYTDVTVNQPRTIGLSVDAKF